jgi:hypothetical protein
MKPAAYWIEHLQLMPHPEGGFYRETYRAAESISRQALPPRFPADRNFSTAIFFLLRAQDRSVFHRIKSDELWHYHAGDALDIYILDNTTLTIHTLGSQVDKGELLQIVVPANTWFGARTKYGDYTLAGCTVSPGFDFADFEMADRAQLLQNFPQHREAIELLTP